MRNKDKDKEQLKEENRILRQRISKLEKERSQSTLGKKDIESEELCSSIIDNSNEAILIHRDGIIKFVNSEASELIGIPKNEFIEKKITDYIHPDYRFIVLNRYERRKKGKEVKSLYEISLLRRDGSVLPAEINVSLIQYKGEPAGLVFLRDITERKEAEKALRERKELLNNVFESMQEGVLVLDTDFKYTYWNRAMERTSKVKKEAVVGKIPWKTFPFLRGKIEEAMKKAMQGEVTSDIELKYSLPKGKEGWTTENYFPLKDKENNIIGVVGVIDDITERKLMEEELIESEARFRNSITQAPFPAMIHAEDGEVILINEVWSEITGYQKEEIPTIEEWTKKAYGKKKDIIKKDIDRLYNKKRRVSEGEYKVKTKKGKERIWEFSSTPIGKMSDNRRLVMSMAHDITERKRAEKALQESDRKFRDIFESANEGIAYTTLSGKLIEINESAEKIFGITSKERIGKNVMFLAKKNLSLKSFKKISPLIDKILKGKKVKTFELQYKNKVLEINTSYNPESKRIIGIIRDITEHKKAEDQIKKSLHEKEVLLREIHHRVKNNMQVISSLINIQAMRLKDTKAKEMFKATRNRVISMAMVHENLYQTENFSRIDFSKYIERMSSHLLSYYGNLSKNIELNEEVEEVFLDINKALPLGLITNELIINSLKHAFPENKKGEIKIEFSKKGNTYYLIVRDNGIGFPQELDFRKAESMGLELVNSLVKQINGKIELHRDKGTTFKITFSE